MGDVQKIRNLICTGRAILYNVNDYDSDPIVCAFLRNEMLRHVLMAHTMLSNCIVTIIIDHLSWNDTKPCFQTTDIRI